VSRQILGRIIEARMEEILNLAYKEISKSGYEDLLAAGVVLTGGTSKTEGTAELTEQIMNMPVRVALPYALGGLSDRIEHPMYSTAVGLVNYASHNESRKIRNASEGWFARTFRKAKNWCLEFF